MNNEYQTNEEELLAKHLANAEKVIENRNQLLSEKDAEIQRLKEELKWFKEKHREQISEAFVKGYLRGVYEAQEKHGLVLHETPPMNRSTYLSQFDETIKK